jgi:hypothetical protein
MNYPIKFYYFFVQSQHLMLNFLILFVCFHSSWQYVYFNGAYSPGLDSNLVSFVFLSKTKHGFHRIIFQKKNSTSKESITATYSHGQFSQIDVGENLNPNIVSNYSRFTELTYTVVESSYFFDKKLFKNFIQNDTEIIIDFGANFYSKPCSTINGTNNCDTTTTIREIVSFRLQENSN